MELREPIEDINKKLLDDYGTEFGNAPKFRVVFSEDQFEKRWSSYTDEGFQLLEPEVREFPKYKQWIQGKYILERLIPIVGETDLTTKINYEPAWVFQDKKGNYLPPFFDGCKLIIDSMFELIGVGGHAKYKDPNVTKEARLEQIKKVEEELFGNETEVGDHLAYKTGVSVPGDDILTKDIKNDIQKAESRVELNKLVH